MRKEQLKNISTEILLERKKKTITTIRILFLVSLFGFLLFLNAYNNTKEITIIHVILAGAIVGGSDDTAQAKKRIMRECGINVVDSPAEIGIKVKEVMG